MAPRASSKTATKKTAKSKKNAASKKASKAPSKTKTPRKKAPAKKAASRKMTPIKQALKLKEIKEEIANNTELHHKDVSNVLEELSILIKRHICKNGAGEFTLPGLMKIVTVKKPARKARKGINPFTGEMTTFKAKPASIAVKIKALKKLKDTVK